MLLNGDDNLIKVKKNITNIEGKKRIWQRSYGLCCGCFHTTNETQEMLNNTLDCSTQEHG
uniref:Uncharacterized protein n=1 Tax=Arion vulgaris TaxID=1028688 RepID=A0A0B7BUJ2_9EUPU